jgi:mono/diheme cytochrome c family protein
MHSGPLYNTVMDEKKYTYRVQWLVLIASALLMVLILIAWVYERHSREWRKYQKACIDVLEELGRQQGHTGSEDPERGILQVELPQLNRVDRCISCHLGIEDARMAEARQPFTLHPGSYLKDHPVRDFGCTICHGGQGRALTCEDASGRLPETHWPRPMLDQPFIQSSCGSYHLAIFGLPGEDTLSGTQGMEVFLAGKQLFNREGCLGCHRARKVGGILGPDLTEQGEKTRHDYSFQNVRGEQSVSNWLKEHFKDPEMVSPGSQMLKILLEEEDLDALATFVMGLSKPDIPFDYFTLSTLNEFKGIRPEMEGSRAFATLCSACHGKLGEGKDYREYLTGVPAIGNPDFLRVASEDFIRFTIEKGRSMRQMGSWAGEVSGVGSGELDGINAQLKGRILPPPGIERILPAGNVQRGRELFDRYCEACHGKKGKGDVALALNQEGFLGKAEDGLILETLLRGRGNTAMPAWSRFSEEELADLVAAIRDWSGSRPGGSRMALPEPHLEEGYRRYHFLCSRCHGEFGEGETGPAIINRDFLEAAGDRYLYETIARGRAHTAMFGWSADVYNSERLEVQDISNIIGFMRSSAAEKMSYIRPGRNPGNSEAGAVLFTERCAECHGPNGEGKLAPALNNQEFLSAASNGYLLATMTLGRTGTRMPSWGYGGDKIQVLTGNERLDLVAYLRSWQRIRIRF